jgi:cation diffusion facilitator CzcD-associated flavoprotein CzcO
MLPFTQTNTLIVGAGISGMATAARLQRQIGISYLTACKSPLRKY